MRPFLLILSAIAVLLVAGAAYLAIGFAEPRDLRLSALTTRLFVPAEIRALPVDARCEAALVSRQWDECGGICGVTYRVTLFDQAAEENVNERLEAYRTATLPDFDLKVRAETRPESGICAPFVVTLSKSL